MTIPKSVEASRKDAKMIEKPEIRKTVHRVIMGDCRRMTEMADEPVQLMVTSPPYFNAPFDYKGFFRDYDEFLELMKACASEVYRVLEDGRIACVNCDDMLVEGEKYPVVADITRIFMDAGFRYRDKIIWRKPEGYVRISRRSGVLLQHPYPMYFYPDNIQESILIFQKGGCDYKKLRARLTPEQLEASKLDMAECQSEKWYLSVWDMTNVLPTERIEKGIAAFPDELPRRIIKLFSYVGETVLDPFLGSGTTSKVAAELGRNSVGYEINLDCLDVIRKKLGADQPELFENPEIEIVIREETPKGASRGNAGEA